jgi:hypothetical protein
MTNPPALPGDSQSLTIPGIREPPRQGHMIAIQYANLVSLDRGKALKATI